jgi:mannose-6-phosphate isomerase-like protein (cupin superfamily)
MKAFVGNIEKKTLENENYREVLFTTDRSQLVVMALPPTEDIGEEVHADHDQFIRVESGEGKAVIEGELFDIHDGDAVVIPAGTLHNIVNASMSESLKLYTIYTPPEHKPGTIHPRKRDGLGHEA